MAGPSRSNRREFLKGRAAADAAADLLQGGDSGQADPSRQGTYLVQIERRAMACDWEVLLNAGQYADGTAAALAALDLVDELEEQLTVFRETSEVMHLNRWASLRPVECEPRLLGLLKYSLELHRQTGGAFDITSGPLTKVWGFYRRAGKIPEPQALAEAMERVGSQYVELNERDETVRFLRDQMELNLGSIGKGYALDRCAELLAEQGVGDFLMHGGQSSVLARGNRLQGNADRGWSVGVTNPLRPGQRLAEIWLRERALATSGTATQHFRHQGKRYGHILDPRSGWPAEGIHSATVVCPSAAEADALATSFYVMGEAAALEFARQRDDLAVLLVLPSKSAGNVRVASHGFREGELSLLVDVEAS